MFFSIEVITLLLVAVINLVIFWMVASQGLKEVSHRFFLFTNTCVVFWILGTALFLTAPSSSLAHVGIVLFYVAPMVMIVSLALFASVFLENDLKKLWSPLNVLLIIFTLVGVLLITGSFVNLTESISLPSGDQRLNQLQVSVYWYFVYFVYFNVAEFVAFYRLFKSIGSHRGRQRQQVKYVTYGAFLSAIISLITNLLMPLSGDSSLIWVGPSSTIFYVVTVGISIVKHGLFDIRQTVVRSAAYVLSLVALAAIYYMLAYVVSVTLFQGQVNSSVSVSPINILLALMLAFIFQPIKSFFDKLTDNIFYRDRYSSEDFFARLSEVLTSTTDLRSLLEKASIEIGSILKTEQAFFFVQYDQIHHVNAGTRHHHSIPMKDAEVLDKYVLLQGGSIIITDLVTDSIIHRMLLSHDVALLMPLIRSNTVIGYLALGEQRGSGFTNRDLKALSTISDELIIAIQNAFSVQEVKNINIHLQQRIDSATAELRSSNAQLRHLDITKDEFLSMASHQLRTPLTSVKGYISMVLEGDAGKITDMQKQLLSEAFSSSERMVHLIHDFLNVSRLQTGKFMLEQHPFDITKLISEEVDSLRHTAESRHMKLEYINEIGELVLNIDENKIRQVVMNFIDNALYYSHEDTAIVINLRQVDGDAEMRVVDTGIGVPKSEQKQLFSKFYRASNARKQRPDGTGVGIYLAKKVVTAHGGDVLFESKEGQGSTFGFTLPVEKLRVTELNNNSN